MKNFPKKAVAIFLGILLAQIFFLIPTSAQAACSWFAEKTFYQGGAVQKTGGCSDIHTKEADNLCSASKPSYTQESGIATNAVCCCEKSPEAQAASSEVCSWEKQSIYYDNATKKQVETTCSSGKEIFTDSNCSGTKPTYISDQYTANKAICCCQKNTISNASQIEVEPPRFQIPELQVNFGVNFSAPVCEVADGTYECRISWLGEYLTAIYNYALKIGGILAAVMLMAGGVMWLISGGDAGKVGTAKEIISGSIIGLVLLFSSYLILSQINPNLVAMRPITLGSISGKHMDAVSKIKDGGAASTYAQQGCASDQELKDGVAFYATGYCKPAYENTDRFFCFIAMNCSCPNGEDTTKNCDKWFGKTYPGYHPCNQFPEDTDYCGRTASGATPEIGTIAGPACDNLPLGRNVCFTKDGKSTTYKITDRGGGIKGKRIDIWTGDCSDATKVSGVGTLKLDVCPGDTGAGGGSW